MFGTFVAKFVTNVLFLKTNLDISHLNVNFDTKC